MRPRCRHRRQMVSKVFINNPNGVGREWSWTGKRSKPVQRYRMVGRLEVRAGRMVRQAGMESRKTGKGQNREDS